MYENNIRTALTAGEVLRISDWSQYVAEKSCNGGCYSFHTRFAFDTKTNLVKTIHTSSCEMIENRDGEDLTLEEAVTKIASAMNDDNNDITVDIRRECHITRYPSWSWDYFDMSDYCKEEAV